MKRISHGIVGVLASVAVASVGTVSAYAASSNVPVTHHITGRAERQMVAHWTNVPAKTLALWESIASKDPNLKVFKNPDGSVTTVIVAPALNGMVLVNGKPATVKNGIYTADVTGDNFTVDLENHGKKLIEKKFSVAKDGTTQDIVFYDDWNTFIANMDEMKTGTNGSQSMNGMRMQSTPSSTTKSGSVSPQLVVDGGGSCAWGLGPYPGQNNGDYLYVGEHVHCNRMNGLYSDNRYWSHGYIQAYTDYLYSDCYYNWSQWGCGSYSSGTDTACDGLGAYYGGECAYDCSELAGWPVTYWRRN